jgi:hypothetical protein
MKLRFLTFVALFLSSGNTHGEETYRCSSLRRMLSDELQRAELHPVRVTASPRSEPNENGDVEPCESFDRAKQALMGTVAGDLERGTLGGHRAAVLSEGPNGTGHYWTLTLAVSVERRTVGACFVTSTSGWRNLPAEGRRMLGRWHVLDGDHLTVWSTLVAGTAEWESLILPFVFHLADGELRLDRFETMKQMDRVGRVYGQVAAMRDDHAPAMHRAAAAAYRSLASGTECD